MTTQDVRWDLCSDVVLRVEDTIDRLAARDKTHRCNLLATLRVLNDTGFNHSAAARRVGVHANTILYRLQTIREVAGLGGNPDELLILMLVGKLTAGDGRG